MQATYVWSDVFVSLEVVLTAHVCESTAPSARCLLFADRKATLLRELSTHGFSLTFVLGTETDPLTQRNGGVIDLSCNFGRDMLKEVFKYYMNIPMSQMGQFIAFTMGEEVCKSSLNGSYKLASYTVKLILLDTSVSKSCPDVSEFTKVNQIILLDQTHKK